MQAWKATGHGTVLQVGVVILLAVAATGCSERPVFAPASAGETAGGAGQVARERSGPVFVPPAVEQALTVEDWTHVAALLAPVDERKPDPVQRLIKGHANLALNANNQALALFLSLRDKADLQRCRAWATRFAKEHSDNATAHYLQGDVLSRLGEHDAAVQCLSLSLKLSPRHLLARHARAVVYATQGKFEAAADDFRVARDLDPKLAELHVSYATYLVQKRADAQKALDSFEEALAISPDYVLALNGRGAMLGQLKKPAEAETALKQAKQLSVGGLADMASVAEMNLAALAGEVNKALEQKAAAVAGWKPGTSIHDNWQVGYMKDLPGYQEVNMHRITTDINPAGGISTQEIASGVNSSDWNVFMSYGLLYTVQTEA
jgi:tetratricopeptide (TPR) repeat protein